MMSPEEILDKKFEKGRGYDKREVDDYLQEIYEAYQELYTKNIEYQDQIKTLNSGLQHYKTIETSLQKALILAEKTADETIQTAKLKSESIIREAENRAAVYSADSKAELEAVHGKTIGLMQEYVRYKAQFNKLIQEQIELLNGSRFEIQTDDLLAFQKINEEANVAKTVDEFADTLPIPETEVADEAGIGNSVAMYTTKEEETASTISFSETSETDTSYEASNVESFPNYKVNGEMNNLDYLNAAERIKEETFQNSDE